MQLTITKNCSSEKNTVPSPISKHTLWLVSVFAMFLFAAMVIAYQPVMFNFFIGDDFKYIWMFQDFKHNLALLLQNYTHSVGPYYRPVLDTIMFCEYRLFGANAFSFRLLSLVFKLLTAFIVMLLVTEFASESQDQELIKSRVNWAVMASAFFALYPLHTEPVAWIAAQTELIANIFVLSSFWFYLQWRKQERPFLHVLSCILAFCAFLTKEATVILPAILVAYDFLIRPKKPFSFPKSVPEFFNSTFPSISHWLILAFYCCLRLIIVGSLTGTWNSGFYNPDRQTMLKGWLQSLKMILLPFSSTMFERNHAIYFAWTALLISLVLLTVFRIRKSRNLILLSIFLLSWFVICLAPMHRLLFISADLLNARYGYTASVPLVAFLSLGLASNAYLKSRRQILNALFVLLLCFSGFVLYTNNKAWAESGQLTNSLIGEFRRIHQGVTGDPKIYVVGIPSIFKGVPIEGMAAGKAMNHTPFAERDYENCVWLHNGDQSLPVGLLHDSLAAEKTAPAIYAWSMKDWRLHTIELPKLRATASPELPLQSLGTAKVISAKQKLVFTFSPIGLSSWSTDLLVFQIDLMENRQPAKNEFVQLDYTNQIKQQTPFLDCLITPLNPNKGRQTLFFTVRDTSLWAFGGYCQNIILTFPKGCRAQINRAFATSISRSKPQIQLTNDQFGELELSPKHPQSTIQYDANFIKNCTGVILEVIARGEYFKESNSLHSDERSLVQIMSKSSHGQIKLDYNMFEVGQLYKVRLRPIDKLNNQIGLCSDYFILLVSK